MQLQENISYRGLDYVVHDTKITLKSVLTQQNGSAKIVPPTETPKQVLADNLCIFTPFLAEV